MPKITINVEIPDDCFECKFRLTCLCGLFSEKVIFYKGNNFVSEKCPACLKACQMSDMGNHITGELNKQQSDINSHESEE